MQLCRSPGKAGHGHIEAAPEQMDGADLAKEGGAKAVQNMIDTNAGPEEAGHGCRIVGPLGQVLDKRDRIGNFVRNTVELGRGANLAQEVDETLVKGGDRHRPRSKRAVLPSVQEPITAWSRRSSTISTPPGRSGTSEVVKPRALT